MDPGIMDAIQLQIERLTIEAGNIQNEVTSQQVKLTVLNARLNETHLKITQLKDVQSQLDGGKPPKSGSRGLMSLGAAGFGNSQNTIVRDATPTTQIDAHCGFGTPPATSLQQQEEEQEIVDGDIELATEPADELDFECSVCSRSSKPNETQEFCPLCGWTVCRTCYIVGGFFDPNQPIHQCTVNDAVETGSNASNLLTQ
ncbi:hypothetical protein Vi05172_g11329 [Venturia inaequalis]|nr:hypothetical protein Vi05172_g11329 [Venturia inaequalis]